jgi:hypothetical protein
MSIGVQVDKAVTSLPLFLTVNRAGAGGITGLSPTVALRDASTLNSYLDFNDGIFKTSGWTTKYAALSEVERGHYQRSLDVSALSVNVFDVLIAEYHVDNGSDVVGDASDLLIITELGGDMKIVRQSITNRMENASGTPGQLVLYDDDGVTPLFTWEIRDEFGGGIIAQTGVPARRGAGTP